MSIRFLLAVLLLLTAPPLLAQADATASNPAASDAAAAPAAGDAAAAPPAASVALAPSPALSDAAITAQVKAALKRAPGVGGLAIHVTTVDGVVKLTGSVPTSVQVDQAEDAVSRVAGVKEVDNRLRAARGS